MIYTIGFTQTTAQQFFERLIKNKIDLLLDIRLNNKSQLAGFAKYPDIAWFSERIANAKYKHDIKFAPDESILKPYKKNEISWKEYERRFHALMEKRKIDSYIESNYLPLRETNICLLCSEPTPEQCHRRLVADYFNHIFKTDIVHI